MNESVVYLQSAYILKHKKYRETSLILDFFTLDFGVLSVLAKGVRKKKSKTAGLLLPFTALKISYVGKNELKTLTHVELDVPNITLTGVSLYSAFYVNELIGFFLHKHDPNSEIFIEYQRCMVALNVSENIEEILRRFEINLLEQVGYGIEFTFDMNAESIVQSEKNYCFNGENGIVANAKGYISGNTLLSIQERKPLNKQALYETKQLMRRIIDFHLQGKILNSRIVLSKILKQI